MNKKLTCRWWMKSVIVARSKINDALIYCCFLYASQKTSLLTDRSKIKLELPHRLLFEYCRHKLVRLYRPSWLVQGMTLDCMWRLWPVSNHKLVFKKEQLSSFDKEIFFGKLSFIERAFFPVSITYLLNLLVRS